MVEQYSDLQELNGDRWGGEGVGFEEFEGRTGCRRNHSDSAALSKHGELTQRMIRGDSRSPPLSRASSVDPVEKPSRALYISRSPEFLERVKSAQRLGLRIFKSALFIPKLSLLTHCAG